VGSSLLKPPGGSPVGGPWNSSGAPNQVGEGRRSVARNLPDRSLLAAATIVILALTFLGILVSVYPTELFSIRSADKPIIPVWESGDEEPRAEQTEDADIPTPTLSSAPTQIDTSGATEETDIDGWASEVVEAALREPVAQGPKKADEAAKGGDDLPRAASYNPAGRPADPALPQVESTPSENTITPSQDPALTSTAQHPDATAQPLPSQTSPPDSPTGTEASPQPSLTLPADNMGTTWQLPPDSPADTEAFPQPSAPPDETIPSS
jgi:hypothetical protein